jgi:hypothetical protein
MSKFLLPAQIEQYREEGCVFPIRVMSEAEAAEHRARLEEFERQTGEPLKGDLRHKSHLLFVWLGKLVRRTAIVDAVEDLYRSDLLCWTTNFFIKEATDPAFVSWHQDSTYWGLSRPDVVTAWVAFTEANEANGAMEYIPGSHKLDQIPHRDTFAKNNLLTRGLRSWSKSIDPSGGSLPCVPARCRCTTCDSSMARRRTHRPTGASASRSVTSRQAWRKSLAKIVRPWCGVRIAITISRSSRSRAAISTRSSLSSTAPSPNATPRFYIAARKSPATTSQGRWRSEPNQPNRVGRRALKACLEPEQSRRNVSSLPGLRVRVPVSPGRPSFRTPLTGV